MANCLQIPGEPADSQLKKESIRLPAYPVEELGGLIFAYFGPQPAPLVPRYNFLVGDGEVYITIQGLQNCNWLQCVENGMDPVHPSFTHGGAWPDIMSTEPELGFHETEWGMVYKAYRKTKEPGMLNYREHHLLMPGVSCGGSGGRYLVRRKQANTPVSAARWSVPIDDTHTLLMRVRFKPSDNPGKYEGDPFSKRWKPPQHFIVPYKEYRDSDNPDSWLTRFRRCTLSKTAWWSTACRRLPIGKMKISARRSTTALLNCARCICAKSRK